MNSFLEAEIGVQFDSLDIDVQISAGRGEIVGLIGANGSGKSTILRSIAGLRALNRGRIVLDGIVVDDATSDTFVEPQQRRCGYVFQDYRLFPHLDALDNVAFGLRASHTRADARRKAADWLERFELADHAHHRPATLSGGQSQRVALARALATEPHVLLLDEPLAASDPAARARIRSDLTRYLAGFDGVTIIVSHDHTDITTLATRAVLVDRGRVGWTGPAADLPS